MRGVHMSLNAWMTGMKENEIIAPKYTQKQSLTRPQVIGNTLVTGHDTQGLSKELKPKKIKGFCKNISFLMLSGYMFKNNKAFFH